MYERLFKFQSRPFASTPSARNYFAGESIHNALAQCRLCIERGSGPVIITGSPGTGKSLLLMMLAEQFKSDFTVVSILCARLVERKDLLQNILYELDLNYRDLSEGELRLSLIDYLKSERCAAKGMLLLVDEAHSLSVDLLDELRLITNFVRDGRPHVSLVMAGSPSLEDHLIETRSESFNQRVAARCYLAHLNQNETIEYILTQVERAGGVGEELFTADALSVIYQASEGCPRIINQICDYALLVASSMNANRITSEIARQAWNDVQCLPGTPAMAAGESMDRRDGIDDLAPDETTVIEFGELADDTLPDLPLSCSADMSGIATSESSSDCAEGTLANSEWPAANDLGEYETLQDNTGGAVRGTGSSGPETDRFGYCVVSDDYEPITVDEHANPFDEPFIEEERVANDYFPEVSEHNLSALTLMPEDLGFLDQIPPSTPAASEQQASTYDKFQPAYGCDFDPASNDDHRNDLRLSKQQLSDLDRVEQDVQRLQTEFDGRREKEPPYSDPRAELPPQFTSIRDDQPVEELMQQHSVAEQEEAIMRFNEGVRDLSTEAERPGNLRGGDDQDIMVIHCPNHHSDDENRQRFPRSELKRATSTGSAERMDYQQLFQQLRSEN